MKGRTVHHGTPHHGTPHHGTATFHLATFATFATYGILAEIPPDELCIALPRCETIACDGNVSCAWSPRA
jgi:hypothetical protein